MKKNYYIFFIIAINSYQIYALYISLFKKNIVIYYSKIKFDSIF